MKRLLTLSTLLLLSIMTYASTLIDGIYYEFSGTEATVVSGINNKYSGTVNIPESVTPGGTTYSVTSIGIRAFYQCPGLRSVTIGNNVKSIGQEAFWCCSGLTSVTIGNSVTNIGSYAFTGCSGLTSVTIPNSVTSIGFEAFYNCSGLTSITIGNSVTSIEGYAFYGCSGLSSVTIPNSVTYINGSAFRYCSGLTSVTIGNSVNYIGAYAFDGCSGLTSVTIGNSVTSIGNNAFYGCSGLTSITIPNSVTSIGQSAFSNCTRLKSLIIGSNVTSIGSSAFSTYSTSISSSLNKIYSLIENPFTIYSSSFKSEIYTKATLYVPIGTKDKYRKTSYWSSFSTIVEIVGVVTLNSEGYATFSNASDVEVDGAEVYTATNKGNYIQCTKVEQTVPAYNGVILKGEPNAIVTLFPSSGLSDYTNNELKATTTADGLAELETALVLSGKKFVNYTGTAFVADKAYMPYDGNSANAIEIVFDDATAINSIASENDLLDGAIIKTIENGTLVIKTANGKYSSVGAKMK